MVDECHPPPPLFSEWYLLRHQPFFNFIRDEMKFVANSAFLNCTGSPYSYQSPLPPILASTVPSGSQVGFAHQQINQHSFPKTGKLLTIKLYKV